MTNADHLAEGARCRHARRMGPMPIPLTVAPEFHATRPPEYPPDAINAVRTRNTHNKCDIRDLLYFLHPSMVFMLLAVAFLSSFGFSEARIDKRAAPQTLVIPVTLDENLIYSVGVNMSFPSQSFSFALTTSTGITTVAGANCDSCAGVPSYNPSASTSVQQLSQTQTVATLNGTASGSLVRENCGLMQSNGSVWAYPNQTVTVANQSASFFSPGISGMIGMGMAPFANTPAANWLRRNPSQPTFTYGMALNPPAESATDGGVLHWLAADQSAYEGAVSWKTISTNSTANISDWVVDMDAWSVAGGPTMFNISQSGVEMPTLLDPYYSSIVFPQPAARSIYASIPGSSKHASSAFSNIWKLPCNTKLRLTVTFGQFSTSLDQKSLVKPQGSICVGVIQEWNSSATTDYLLGSPFIAVLYLIFAFSQSGDGSVGFAQRSAPSTKLSPGGIAGVVLGTVAVAALLVIAGVFVYFAWQRCMRYRRKTLPTPFRSVSESPLQSQSRVGLLAPGSNSNPNSPDWRSTFISGETNTFAGGTGTAGSNINNAYYRTDIASSATDVMDSPPPYLNSNSNSNSNDARLSPPPVPLVPLRKNRRVEF